MPHKSVEFHVVHIAVLFLLLLTLFFRHLVA